MLSYHCRASIARLQVLETISGQDQCDQQGDAGPVQYPAAESVLVLRVAKTKGHGFANQKVANQLGPAAGLPGTALNLFKGRAKQFDRS